MILIGQILRLWRMAKEDMETARNRPETFYRWLNRSEENQRHAERVARKLGRLLKIEGHT